MIVQIQTKNQKNKSLYRKHAHYTFSKTRANRVMFWFWNKKTSKPSEFGEQIYKKILVSLPLKLFDLD